MGKRMLLLFIIAGLILAAVIGVYVYQVNRAPSREEASTLIADFVERIASGETENARLLLTAETRGLLRDPGTVLGETVYRSLRLKSVENLFSEGGNIYAADVILSTPDTLKIMAKAGILFGEQITEKGEAENADQLMAEIYGEILSRDDIPMTDHFCVVRMEWQNGELLIIADERLIRAVEGGSAENSNVLKQLGFQ